MTGSGLTRWAHPQTGEQITFRDCRPGVKATAALEPEPPVLLPSQREVANHEARHAAAALMLGITVTEARADWPDFLDEDKAHVVGYVKCLPAATWTSADGRIVATGRHRTARKDAIVTLAGDMSDDRNTKAVGYTGEWPPAWPPTAKLGPDSDEARLAEYVRAAGLDEHGWQALCDEAKRLADMEEFQELAGRIGSLLEHGIAMNERMLTDAYEMVIRNSIKGMHRQLDTMAAKIRQMSRELDEPAAVDLSSSACVKRHETACTPTCAQPMTPAPGPLLPDQAERAIFATG